MKTHIFEDFNHGTFWDDSDYALKAYVCPPPSGEFIRSIENELGFKLPESYILLMKHHNGGKPHPNCFPTKEPTSWADDHVAISGILGIGREKPYSLCGSLGSPFMIEEWGYPEIGVCICVCPSAGHDMIMLDYRQCGKGGEPAVVHVDQENDFRITKLAPNFEQFILGLVNEEEFDTSEESLDEDLHKVETGHFSELLESLIANQNHLDFEVILRNLCREITLKKGGFALHADELSYLVYDLQFYLFSQMKNVRSASVYLDTYPNIIALSKATFSTCGYAPVFVKDWLMARISEGKIVENSPRGLTLEKDFQAALLRDVKTRFLP